MGYGWQINGEAMVEVFFGDHMTPVAEALGVLASGETNPLLLQLGLSQDPIRVMPKVIHADLRADDFGPEGAPETLSYIADAEIRMTLLMYDDRVLDMCLQEAMGAGGSDQYAGGSLGSAKPMGAGLPLQYSGNHYITMGIRSPRAQLPYRFLAAYLAQRPVEIPLGTGVTAAICNWRAIPYVNLDPFANPLLNSTMDYVKSAGAIIWDREYIGDHDVEDPTNLPMNSGVVIGSGA